ncbi:DNA-dependent RNA polymerase auxiliary subunit epsilon [Terribacillus halophilus]|uniref:DNA-directed RNA polymerase subunit epsilon n=1 Tax=Terribacillus halophilus TaxID=361279 RepID=A0A1G6NM53_9BACI|nr:DNA-directed RNA polymerase subunit epsilon [Terribacillus halophilus]SDC68474.1 DNA-dependent RNA polymerase auxiliary subunit epsilon [Terribacillus halophilus]
MVFKVYYQENPSEIPVRERTESLYMEAENVRQVRKTLADRAINIEFIQPLDEAHLEYEKQSENFNLEQAK